MRLYVNLRNRAALFLKQVISRPFARSQGGAISGRTSTPYSGLFIMAVSRKEYRWQSLLIESASHAKSMLAI